MITDMSIEGLSEVLHSIIHEENMDTCTMIGHSMGGYITLAFAEKYWNHLEQFGLVHSTAYADNEEKKSTRKKGIEFIKEHGAFEFLKTTTPNLFSEKSKLQLKQTIENFIESLSGFSENALTSYYTAMINRPDRTSVLKNSTHPVLIVAGENDNAVPLEDILQQSHLSQTSQFLILKNSGHMGMLEEPVLLNKILIDFLS
jgi:pimeloyl-ACP methyl ester carboxylesterase